MKSELGDKQRIEQISDACSKILLCTKDYNEEKFVNHCIIAATVHSFIMIIGEASNAVSKDFKKNHSEFDWALMKDMRNIIAHEYFGIDENKVWDTATNDIPKLKTDCENVLKDSI